MSNKKIEIMDTTLRDGEQTSGISFSPIEKLSISKLLLEELKIDRIEVASARVSEGEMKAVKLITDWAKDSGFDDKIEILSFQDLIDQANKEKEVELKFDLERNVKLVSFNKGKIDISFNEKLNQNFIKSLTEKLLLWTGERWVISLSKNNVAKSIYEQNMEKKSSKLEEFKKSDLALQIEEAFPDAKLINIQEENND